MEAFLAVSGLSDSKFERFMTYGQSRRNRRFFMQHAMASVIKLCDTVLMEEQYLLDEIKCLEDERQAPHPGFIPADCRIVISSGGKGSDFIFQIGLLFLSRVCELTQTKHFMNARFQVGTILLGLIVPSNSCSILGRLSKTEVLDKFMFNALRAMM